MWSSSAGGMGSGGSQFLFESTARASGNRIKERLIEIIGDYDEKISECDMIMEGTILANSLAHTQTNMKIALSTKRDSSHMKSIALLTAVFLPPTFAAVR
ncbi:hypothetical protein K4K49_010055 [Colletotrichum sp. SAR 10_70]|nr:hypothetical protein K4K50_009257 [Colletotrichum sp. SAR 10_71]KAI8194151.1 hypothetical protein K4K49_010055 [Colletotrichum sp. SAR 10_70]KAI8228750.1 hypothetical protein K4K54_001970 [Colletotrichum sp. SAR 10_86]